MRMIYHQIIAQPITLAFISLEHVSNSTVYMICLILFDRRKRQVKSTRATSKV